MLVPKGFITEQTRETQFLYLLAGSEVALLVEFFGKLSLILFRIQLIGFISHSLPSIVPLFLILYSAWTLLYEALSDPNMKHTMHEEISATHLSSYGEREMVLVL